MDESGMMSTNLLYWQASARYYSRTPEGRSRVCGIEEDKRP